MDKNHNWSIEWRNTVLTKRSEKDAKILEEFNNAECSNANMKSLMGEIPKDIDAQILDNSFVNFEDMMLRTQDALRMEAKKEQAARKLEPPKKHPLQEQYEREGYHFPENAINIFIEDVDISEGPILLDVKKMMNLFRNGTLDSYIAAKEVEANNLQRKLILALEGPAADIEDEPSDNPADWKTKKVVAKPIRPKRKNLCVPQEKQTIPMVHQPNKDVMQRETNVALEAEGLMHHTRRKRAIALKKTFLPPPRKLILVPNRVKIPLVHSTIPSSDHTDVSPGCNQKIVDNNSSLAPIINFNTTEWMVSPSVLNFLSTVTLFSAQQNEEHQGELCSNQSKSLSGIFLNSVPTVSVVPNARPASARKTPHVSTMYGSSKPKQRGSSTHYHSRETCGPKYVVKSDSLKVDISEEGPRVVSTVGGISDFTSKIICTEKQPTQQKTVHEEEQLPKRKGAYWLLDCDTCTKIFPLFGDNSYRQHLIIDHSIEVDDMEIEARKFFATTEFKCRKCYKKFYRDHETHHLVCSPLIPLERSFEAIPIIVVQKEIIKCGICNLIFGAKLYLHEHLKQYHNEHYMFTLLDPKYRCGGCLKAFENSVSLTTHVVTCIETHSTEETALEIAHSLQKCEICSTTHDKLSTLQLRYTEKKIIRCMLCLYICISRQKFKRHMKLFHRRNKVGISCPFCPDSEAASVRAQFEHIANYHYKALLQEENAKPFRSRSAASHQPIQDNKLYGFNKQFSDNIQRPVALLRPGGEDTGNITEMEIIDIDKAIPPLELSNGTAHQYIINFTNPDDSGIPVVKNVMPVTQIFSAQTPDACSTQENHTTQQVTTPLLISITTPVGNQLNRIPVMNSETPGVK